MEVRQAGHYNTKITLAMTFLGNYITRVRVFSSSFFFIFY